MPSLRVRLRLLHGLAGLCGVPTFFYGVNHILAAAGSEWSSIPRAHPLTQLLIGLILVGAGSLCALMFFQVGRLVYRMDRHQSEIPLRALFVRAREIRVESLRHRPENPQAPRSVRASA
jgi:hypothetical protein